MSESTSNFKSIEFTWKITDFSQQKINNGPGKFIRSQAFPGDCEGDLKFYLYFYPQSKVQPGDTEVTNGEKWASLFLKTEGTKKYINSHRIELSILDADGEKFATYHFHKKISFDNMHGYPKFIRLADLENSANYLLPDDTLTICCRVEETKSETEGVCNCQIEEPQIVENRRKLVESLTSITSHKYADFVFKVENVRIPVHRVILATRSPVFHAMFQHDMKEGKTNETEITDVSLAAFKALLQFIYTGHCKFGNLAEQLLVVANKYDIQDLKQICGKELRMQLTVDNAVRLLILSDLHNANNLKDGVMRFINKNAPAVMKTPSWINFPDSHQHLIRELYNKLFE